ncbi:hypothetical protein CH370_13505 [Leptospira kmetyi]|uniref:Uncharacterized protein n=1 Tax=Leptospira kmetyi TaxID=408139 RepID=A0ABX4N399_9LEPT|nr:hypothetical protein CH378_20695 [Leptospira kmetyi]PJZ40776.1 hypothetical protein CH370_13505 [Leptospira kmetyi]TGK16298.1 hypothetical protein EHO62_11155 [Leptospira kmetyi]TGK32328.1 hypothetical protein EHO66_08135 [Leptospira kmetyi]TGL66228.1 hypothetical protein EHQ67_17595 [Leptospira kmetyi]
MCDHTRVQSDRKIAVLFFRLVSGRHDRTDLPGLGNLQENENPMEDSGGSLENGNVALDSKKTFRNFLKGI